MPIAAQFTIARIWKEPKCSKVDKMDQKDVAYLYNRTHSMIKKDKIMPFAAT